MNTRTKVTLLAASAIVATVALAALTAANAETHWGQRQLASGVINQVTVACRDLEKQRDCVTLQVGTLVGITVTTTPGCRVSVLLNGDDMRDVGRDVLGQFITPRDDSARKQLEECMSKGEKPASAKALYSVKPQSHPTAEALPVTEKDFDDIIIRARSVCARAVENTAYDLRWIGGWLTSRFDHWQKERTPDGNIVIGGDGAEAQLQNGAWVRVVYHCEYNSATETAVKAWLERGHY